VLGVKTAPIIKVVSYKPAVIPIYTGVIDVTFIDEDGKCYHLEEERNFSEDDLYRFATYHFPVAREWNDKVEDLILISGKPYYGKREIQTVSGLYKPRFIDLTERDGEKRLEEIRLAIEAGNFENVFELIFIPLYGKEQGKKRSKFVEKVLKVEVGFYKKGLLPQEIVVASLIISNKMVNKTVLEQIWEDIKMFQFIDFAMNKGRNEGLDEGLNKGLNKGRQEMLIKALQIRHSIINKNIADKINNITDSYLLDGLFTEALKSDNLMEFEAKLNSLPLELKLAA